MEGVGSKWPMFNWLARGFRGDLLHNRDFLRLWAGQTVSVAGSQIGNFALPLVAILTLNASSLQLGVMRGLSTLPYFLIALLAGVWVDRLRRRPVLIASDVWRGLITISVPAAALIGILSINQLFAVAFLVGVGTVLFEFAYASYLPHLVGRDALLEGNSKLQLSQSAFAIAGPGIAGALVQALTAPIAVLVDGISFLASAASLLLIRKGEPPPESGAERHLGRELREGFDFVRRQPFLRAQVATTATFNVFVSITLALQLLYLVRELHFQPALIGFLFTLGAPGALIGSLLARPLAQRFGIGYSMIGAVLLNGLTCLLLPAASGPGLLATVLVVGYAFCFGIALQVYNINVISVRQAITPDRLLGRMNGVTRFVTWGIIPLASVFGGALGQWVGLRPALVVGGVGASLTVLWLLFSPARGWRTLAEATA